MTKNDGNNEKMNCGKRGDTVYAQMQETGLVICLKFVCYQWVRKLRHVSIHKSQNR